MTKKSKKMWRVLPLCLIVFATGLTSCDDALEADDVQSRFSSLGFLKMMDVEESDLMDKDQLPEWLVPIVNEREENDPSTAVFTAKVDGKLVYNVYYISKRFWLLGNNGYVDLYYSDGTKVPFLTGPGTEILYQPEKWCMIYCGRPDLYRKQPMREELVEKDELPDWMVSKIDSCKSIIVVLMTRDDKQAYDFCGSLKPALINDRSVLLGTYYPDGTRCAQEEGIYFRRSTDQCIIYLQEEE